MVVVVVVVVLLLLSTLQLLQAAAAAAAPAVAAYSVWLLPLWLRTLSEHVQPARGAQSPLCVWSAPVYSVCACVFGPRLCVQSAGDAPVCRM